ncbi:hypothetical protein [Actinomadura madurae]|nr:hypothetical protein [Actinomadura madurae]
MTFSSGTSTFWPAEDDFTTLTEPSSSCRTTALPPLRGPAPG